jgi:hypothetical protein
MQANAVRHIGYGRYILRHKWYVFLEACRLGIPWRGLTHDLSKLRPDEWGPYADYFYGGRFPDGSWGGAMYVPNAVAEAFDRAWLLHQKRNDHHWQWHVLREDSGATKLLPLGDAQRREMLADWRGAGRAITGKDNTREWWLRNRDKMLLHDETREWVNRRLGVTSDNGT